MINLQQDTDGFIRMSRHFPGTSTVTITFTDGSTEEFPGQVVNKAYDDALADYRAKNHLDAKGFSRVPKNFPGSNRIDFVPVSPGMGS